MIIKNNFVFLKNVIFNDCYVKKISIAYEIMSVLYKKKLSCIFI